MLSRKMRVAIRLPSNGERYLAMEEKMSGENREFEPTVWSDEAGQGQSCPGSP